MIRGGVLTRPTPTPAGSAGITRLYAFAAGCSVVLGFLVAHSHGLLLRLLMALVVTALLASLSLARPGAGVIATITYLVFMPFFRRVLIPAANWTSFDPLLMVGPAVAGILLIKLFVLERRRIAPDLLSKLVLILLLLTVVEVANPFGFGIKANLVAVLFTTTPLFWFFIGREVFDDRLIYVLLGTIVVLALISAVYGLYQTQVGYPPWDQNWLNSIAYQQAPYGTYSDALTINGQLRSIGPFSSFWEYAEFLGSALAIAFAFAMRRRPVAVLALPVLAVALFFASNRSGLITTALAIVVMLALSTRRAVAATLIAVCAIGGAYGGLKLFSSKLSSAASSSGSGLVSHQLSGLSDPTSSQNSTLLVHLNEVKTGVQFSLHHPLGVGGGTTNQAAGVSQQSSLQNSITSGTNAGSSTEVDVSNAFVDYGPGGGALYVLVMLVVLGTAARSYFRGRDVILPVIGLLIVGAGQWWTGNHYALSPITWLLIGTIAAGSVRSGARVGERPPVADRPLWQRGRRAATS